MPPLAMGIALGPAVGTLAGGLIVASLGLARDVFRLRPVTLIWLRAVATVAVLPMATAPL